MLIPYGYICSYNIIDILIYHHSIGLLNWSSIEILKNWSRYYFTRAPNQVGESESGESRARSSWDSRVQPKLRANHEKWGRSLGWAPPQNFFGILNFKSFKLVFSWNKNLEIIDFSIKTFKKFHMNMSSVHNWGSIKSCSQLGVNKNIVGPDPQPRIGLVDPCFFK